MSNYPTTNGYYVYGHRTPRHQWYIGMSKQQPSRRWKPSMYKGMSLEPYIEEYGWDNIEHRVLIDGLNRTQAELIEDIFITRLRDEGLCMNKQRSGGRSRDKTDEWKQEISEHKKQYYEDNKEHIREYQKQYYEANAEHLKEQVKQYRQMNAEAIKEYQRQYYKDNCEQQKQRASTPEGKIYQRVANFNRHHTPIETPLEAKQKYLETGYVPRYIKNDDLQ